MLWSILICGVPERYHTVHPLLFLLMESQSVARIPDIHLEYKMDNKRVSVGEKRTQMLQQAKGEYVSFIDDDDMVASDYVSKIKYAITQTRHTETPADVICFPQRATLSPAGVTHECTYSLQNKERKLAPTEKPNVLLWTGPPAHTMVWRTALVRDVAFPDKMFAEDVAWVDQACACAKHEVVLRGEPLYFYNFDERTTTTR